MCQLVQSQKRCSLVFCAVSYAESLTRLIFSVVFCNQLSAVLKPGYWWCLGTAKWLSDNDLSFIQHDTFSSFAYASVALICLKNNTGSIKARKSLLAALAVVGEIHSEDGRDGSRWIPLSGLGLSKRAQLRTWDSPSLILQLEVGWSAILVRFEKVHCGSWCASHSMCKRFTSFLCERWCTDSCCKTFLWSGYFRLIFFFSHLSWFQAWFNSWT